MFQNEILHVRKIDKSLSNWGKAGQVHSQKRW